MRDSLNCTMLPIVQDNCISFTTTTNGTITNIPSNGYYGYQPPSINDNNNKLDKNGQQYDEEMDVVMQFEEYDNRRRFVTVNNRKRSWQISGDVRQFKKRRQNHHDEAGSNYDTSPTITQQPPPPPTITTTGSSTRDVVWLRKPTHNLPDMPRCIMGHYV